MNDTATTRTTAHLVNNGVPIRPTVPTASQDVRIDVLGDGNWEATTPNGTWTITADRADWEAPGTQFHISHDDNHHQPEGWVADLQEALVWLEANGVDRRTTRHQA